MCPQAGGWRLDARRSWTAASTPARLSQRVPMPSPIAAWPSPACCRRGWLAGVLAFGRSGTLEAGERGTARDASGAHTLIGVHAAAAADHPITDALGWRRTSPFRYANCPCPPDVAIVICPISGGRCAHGPWPPTTPASLDPRSENILEQQFTPLTSDHHPAQSDKAVARGRLMPDPDEPHPATGAWPPVPIQGPDPSLSLSVFLFLFSTVPKSKPESWPVACADYPPPQKLLHHHHHNRQCPARQSCVTSASHLVLHPQGARIAPLGPSESGAGTGALHSPPPYLAASTLLWPRCHLRHPDQVVNPSSLLFHKFRTRPSWATHDLRTVVWSVSHAQPCGFSHLPRSRG
jgi:hypothetical protein